METSRLHVFIEGWVQGVGFRYATCDQAEALRLTGWVRNLPDGRVEAEFEGARACLEAVLAWCQHGPAGSSVSQVKASWETGEPQYHHFRIRH